MEQIKLNKDKFSSYGGVVLQVSNLPDFFVEDGLSKKTEFHITILNKTTIENIFKEVQEKYNLSVNETKEKIEVALDNILQELETPEIFVSDETSVFVSNRGNRFLILEVINQLDWKEYVNVLHNKLSEELNIDVDSLLCDEDKNPIFHISVASKDGASMKSEPPTYLQFNLSEGVEQDFGEVAFGDSKSGSKFYGKSKPIEKDTPIEHSVFKTLKKFFDSGMNTQSVIDDLLKIDIQVAKEEYPEIFQIPQKVIEDSENAYRGISLPISTLLDYLVGSGIQDNLVNLLFFGNWVASNELTFKNTKELSSWTSNIVVAGAFSETNSHTDRIPCLLIADITDKNFFMNPLFTNYMKTGANIKFIESEFIYKGSSIEPCVILVNYSLLKDIFKNGKYNNIELSKSDIEKLQSIGIENF